MNQVPFGSYCLQLVSTMTRTLSGHEQFVEEGQGLVEACDVARFFDSA